MTRAATLLLTVGVILFVGVLASQGLPAIMATLSLAGWGLLLVAAFHLVPLGLDAMAIRVLFDRTKAHASTLGALLTRWAGESANSLMPGGQIGGPVMMTRHLAQQGMTMQDAAAAITVSTTMQTFAQIAFALLGVTLVGARATHLSTHALQTSALVASGFLAVQIGGFYLLQRRGFFSKITRAASRFSGKRDLSHWVTQAKSMDLAVEATYRRPGAVLSCALLNLAGWLVGTGEVFLILVLLGHPVTWVEALLLESLGQAIRGAAFAIPGALGVQEAGFLLFGGMLGLPVEIAAALAVLRRCRDLICYLPGIIVWQIHEGKKWVRL